MPRATRPNATPSSKRSWPRPCGMQEPRRLRAMTLCMAKRVSTCFKSKPKSIQVPISLKSAHVADDARIKHREEERDANEAHEGNAVSSRQMDGDVFDCCEPGVHLLGASGHHNDCSGHGVSRRWHAECGNTATELAGIYNGDQSGHYCRPD